MHVTETHTNTKPKQFCTSHTQICTPKSNMKYLVNFLTCAPLAHLEVQRERERETGRRKWEGEQESMSAMGEQEREREKPS